MRNRQILPSTASSSANTAAPGSTAYHTQGGICTRSSSVSWGAVVAVVLRCVVVCAEEEAPVVREVVVVSPRDVVVPVVPEVEVVVMTASCPLVYPAPPVGSKVSQPTPGK